MDERCPECGAVVPSGGVCRDRFNDLLALEWEVPDGAGELAHYYAVTSYVLQHPVSMNYRADVHEQALVNLRRVLAGELTLATLLALTRRAADGPVRVLRRPDDPPPPVLVREWPMTVADVTAGGDGGVREKSRGVGENDGEHARGAFQGMTPFTDRSGRERAWRRAPSGRPHN